MTRKIIVVGAGPAGLSFSRALAGSPHQIELIERQPVEALAHPAPDGREIALTLRSKAILEALDVWRRFPEDAVYPLREARVRNGSSPFVMAIGTDQPGNLGHLVSNHLIRGALYEAVSEQANVTLHAGRKVVRASTDPSSATVVLDDGSSLVGDLLIAADSRFSQIRNQLGIDASVTRFGHTMLVCRIRHSSPHRGISTEWFDHGRTIALLPLGEGVSGLVVTLSDGQAKQLCALPEAAIEQEFARYLDGQCGAIALITRPTAYPLAMTYAERFSTTRAALIGDAAVGKHPVTAHGFNFGLLSAWRLAGLVGHAADPGLSRLLRRYAVQHRLATMPLYEGTRQLVKLYTDDRLIARPLRAGILRIGAMAPFTRAMGKLLGDAKAA